MHQNDDNQAPKLKREKEKRERKKILRAINHPHAEGINISWRHSGDLELLKVGRRSQWKCFRFCLAFPEGDQKPFRSTPKKKKFQKFTLKWKQTSQ